MPINPEDAPILTVTDVNVPCSGDAPGKAIASVNDPYAGLGLGTTTYTAFSASDRLMLSGPDITLTAGEIVGGATYPIGVEAVSGNGKRRVGETFDFPALGALSLGLSTPLTVGVPDSGEIVGAAEGTNLFLQHSIAGLSLNTQNRTWHWDGGPTDSTDWANAPATIIIGEEIYGTTRYSSIELQFVKPVPVFSSAPSINGTMGGTLTANPGTVTNAVSISRQWYRDLLPIEGATGATLDGAAWPGSIIVVETATGIVGDKVSSISSSFNNGSNDIVLASENFEAATVANQKLSTVSGAKMSVLGGNLAERDKYVIKTGTTDKWLGSTTTPVAVTVGGKPSVALAVSTSSLGSNHAVEADIIKTGGASSLGNIVINFVDEFNYVLITCSGSSLFIRHVKDGISTDVGSAKYGAGTNIPISTALYTSRLTIRAEISNGILTVLEKFDGGPLTVLPIVRSGVSKAQFFDFKQVQGWIAGDRAGFISRGSTSGTVWMRFISLDKPVSISAITVDTISNSPIMNVDLSYAGVVEPTGFDIAVMAGDGRQVITRQSATLIASGAGLATVSFSSPGLRTIEGKSAYAQIWKVGAGLAGDQGVAKQFAMPIYQTVFSWRQGLNEGGLSASKPVDPFRDLAGVGMWRTIATGGYAGDFSDVKFNRFGFPTSYPASDPSGWALLLPEPTDATADRVDRYFTVLYPPSLTIAPFDNNMSVEITGPGTARYFRKAGSTSPQQLRFTGPMPTGEDLKSARVIITPEVDAHPERSINDGTATTFAALGRTLRVMSARRINGSRYKVDTASLYIKYSAEDRIVGPVGTHGISVEYQVGACNDAGIHMYYNANHATDESYIREEARITAQNLRPDLTCEIEWSNEVWNNAFPQFDDVALEGCRMGLAADGCNSWNTRGLSQTITLNSSANHDTTQFPVQAGQIIYANIGGVGGVVVRAKADLPVNTYIPTNASDGNWDLVFSSTQTGAARARHQAYASERMFRIWDEEFLAVGRTRPIHILGTSTGTSLSSWAVTMLEWTANSYADAPLRTVTDRLAIAPYWSHPGGGNIGDYTKEYVAGSWPHPWTATEKALVSTNFEAFKAAFFAISADSVDYAISRAKQYKHSLANYLVGKNMSPDAIQLMSYEANWHVIFTNWPSNLLTDANSAFGKIIRSPEFGAVTMRYIDGLRKNIGGTHCFFDRIGSIPKSGAGIGDAEQSWAMMEGEWDTATTGSKANYRFKAFADGNTM